MTATTLDILLLEDEPAHIAAIERAFSFSDTKAVIRVVGTLREYREVVAACPPDIAMLDLILPDGRAVEVLISPPEAGAFPVLVMTSHGDEQMAVAAIKAGALDYIVKSPETFAGMPRTVERALREWKLLQQGRQTKALLDLENAALAAAANAILITDRAGIIRQVNPAFTTITGYAAAEAIGRNPRELLKSGEHDATFYRNLWETILAGRVWHSEITNHRKDGSRYVGEQTITPVRNEQGNIVHFISISQDNTEKKKLEAQLLRTQRLESVGQLASGIAHDLNNILAPILMAAPLLQNAVRDPAARKIVDIVNANAWRGAAIVKQLLSFSRGLEGRRAPLQLKSLLREMEMMIKETFPKNIRLRVERPPDPWLVTCDPTQLHQVLMNLCLNARDAMPDGGALTLGLENAEMDAAHAATIPGAVPGRYMILSVADTGTGIPPEILNKIYDPFFTTKEVGRGTGLGLSTVLGIVKSHQGFVQVKTELGRGTQFQVLLPAVAAEGAAPTPVAPETLPQGTGELILVVDDEANVRQVTHHILEAYGYRVVDFGAATAALDWYASHGPETRAVISDMVMPEMDGTTFIRNLRRLNPQVRIIAVSGNQPEAGAPPETEAKTQARLVKPFTVETLLRTLGRVLHSTEPGAPVA